MMFKDEEACDTYFGNVCTGFGNDDTTCWLCGWDMYEHPEYKINIERLFPNG
jgi:hypothetical protein